MAPSLEAVPGGGTPDPAAGAKYSLDSETDLSSSGVDDGDGVVGSAASRGGARRRGVGPELVPVAPRVIATKLFELLQLDGSCGELVVSARVETADPLSTDHDMMHWDAHHDGTAAAKVPTDDGSPHRSPQRAHTLNNGPGSASPGLRSRSPPQPPFASPPPPPRPQPTFTPRVTSAEMLMRRALATLTLHLRRVAAAPLAHMTAFVAAPFLCFFAAGSMYNWVADAATASGALGSPQVVRLSQQSVAAHEWPYTAATAGILSSLSEQLRTPTAGCAALFPTTTTTTNGDEVPGLTIPLSSEETARQNVVGPLLDALMHDPRAGSVVAAACGDAFLLNGTSLGLILHNASAVHGAATASGDFLQAAMRSVLGNPTATFDFRSVPAARSRTRLSGATDAAVLLATWLFAIPWVAHGAWITADVIAHVAATSAPSAWLAMPAATVLAEVPVHSFWITCSLSMFYAAAAASGREQFHSSEAWVYATAVFAFVPMHTWAAALVALLMPLPILRTLRRWASDTANVGPGGVRFVVASVYVVVSGFLITVSWSVDTASTADSSAGTIVRFVLGAVPSSSLGALFLLGLRRDLGVSPELTRPPGTSWWEHASAPEWQLVYMGLSATLLLSGLAVAQFVWRSQRPPGETSLAEIASARQRPTLTMVSNARARRFLGLAPIQGHEERRATDRLIASQGRVGAESDGAADGATGRRRGSAVAAASMEGVTLMLPNAPTTPSSSSSQTPSVSEEAQRRREEEAQAEARSYGVWRLGLQVRSGSVLAVVDRHPAMRVSTLLMHALLSVAGSNHRDRMPVGWADRCTVDIPRDRLRVLGKAVVAGVGAVPTGTVRAVFPLDVRARAAADSAVAAMSVMEYVHWRATVEWPRNRFEAPRDRASLEGILALCGAGDLGQTRIGEGIAANYDACVAVETAAVVASGAPAILLLHRPFSALSLSSSLASTSGPTSDRAVAAIHGLTQRFRHLAVVLNVAAAEDAELRAVSHIADDAVAVGLTRPAVSGSGASTGRARSGWTSVRAGDAKLEGSGTSDGGAALVESTHFDNDGLQTAAGFLRGVAAGSATVETEPAPYRRMLAHVKLSPDPALPVECQQFAVARSVAVESVTRSPRWAPRFGLLVYRIFLELDVWANRAPAVAPSATALQHQSSGSKKPTSGNAARHALGMPTALVLSASRSGGIDVAIRQVLAANCRIEAAFHRESGDDGASAALKREASFVTDASDGGGFDGDSRDGLASVHLFGPPKKGEHSPQSDGRMLMVPTLLAPPPLPSRQTRNPLLNDLSESLLSASANRGPAAYAAAASTYVPRTEAGIRAVHSERKRRQLLVEVFGTDTVFDFGDEDLAEGPSIPSKDGPGRHASESHSPPAANHNDDGNGGVGGAPSRSPPMPPRGGGSLSPSPDRVGRGDLASSVGAAPPSRARHQCDRHRRRKQERRLRSTSPHGETSPSPDVRRATEGGIAGDSHQQRRTPSPLPPPGTGDTLRNDNEL